MKHILVTGAAGFIGQGIIEQILDLEKSIQITACDFKDCGIIDDRVKSVSANLFSLENPYEYFGKPNVVLHLAWRDGFKHNSNAHIEDLQKHYAFLKKMVESGVSQISIMGTMHEVGFHEGSINEDTPCRPLSLYGVAKNALRTCCELMTQGTETRLQWIRGYYIVDNTSKGCSIFSKIVQAEESGQKLFPFTTGINQYDFLDYPDFCKQIAAITLDSNETGIINACSGKPERLADRVEKFIKENNFKIKLEYGKYPDRCYDSLSVWGNAEKVKKIMEKRGLSLVSKY